MFMYWQLLQRAIQRGQPDDLKVEAERIAQQAVARSEDHPDGGGGHGKRNGPIRGFFTALAALGEAQG